MSERHFNEEEKDLLRKYQGLSTSSLGGRLAFEIVAPLVFVAAWLYTGRAIYLLALIVALVGYNIFRALKRHRTLRKLSSTWRWCGRAAGRRHCSNGALRRAAQLYAR
jgi:hypothetical protein